MKPDGKKSTVDEKYLSNNIMCCSCVVRSLSDVIFTLARQFCSKYTLTCACVLW
jgi:hypothetical protein